MPNEPLPEILSYSQATSLELVLRAYLLPDIDAQIYFNRRPQNSALPCIVVEKLAEDRSQYLVGNMTVADYRFQFSVMAETYEVMLEVTNRLKDLMQGFSGDWDDRVIFYVNLDTESDAPSDPSDGSDNYTYIREVQYLIKAQD
jgi:hypothetical protein